MPKYFLFPLKQKKVKLTNGQGDMELSIGTTVEIGMQFVYKRNREQKQEILMYYYIFNELLKDNY